jgi:hypothetical protein
MNRNVFFMTALTLIGTLTISSCEKPQTESPYLEGYQMDLDFNDVEDGALAVSFGDNPADSKVLTIRESAGSSEEVHLIAYRDREHGIILASPGAKFLTRQLPVLKEWRTRQEVQIRKTTLTPEETDNLREGEASTRILEAFRLGESVGDGQTTGPVQEGDVFAIKLPDGDVVLVKTSVCIGVYTAAGHCIGIYIKRDKKK